MGSEVDTEYLHLSTLRNDDRYFWFVIGTGGYIFYLPYDQKTIYYSTEYDVFSVQEITIRASDVELATVGVFTAVRLKIVKIRYFDVLGIEK